MAPSSASGELWVHFMPEELTVDFLLPNGLLLPLKCFRDSTLAAIKLELWRVAENYPLCDRLQRANHYIFATVALGNSSAEDTGNKPTSREIFYDESKRLCDLHLFVPVLTLVEPEGNRQERELAQQIGAAIGHSLDDYDDSNDVEMHRARCSFFRLCEVVVRQRRKGGDDFDWYCFPADIVQAPEGPAFESESAVAKLKEHLVSVWMSAPSSSPSPSSGAPSGGQKITLKVNLSTSTAPDLIRKAIRQRMGRLSPTLHHQVQLLSPSDKTVTVSVDECAQTAADEYLLKIVGCQLYLIDTEAPLIHFKYVQECVQQGETPLLMLMGRSAAIQYKCVDWQLTQPAFLRRTLRNDPHSPSPGAATAALATSGGGMAEQIDSETIFSLWEVDSMFRLRLISASNINITDVDLIYVRIGIYHGPDLMEEKDSVRVSPSNLRWNEVIQFELYIPDIPHDAQICFSICAVKQRKQKEENIPLAWVNIRLIDFKDYFLDEKYALHLWHFPKGFEGWLNPLGPSGTNWNKNGPLLEVEFECFEKRVRYPTDLQITDYQNFQQKWRVRKKEEDDMIDPKNVPAALLTIFNGISTRGPTQDLSEDEKECIWQLREYCRVTSADALPRLLDSVKWSSRAQVAETYRLLDRWPLVGVDTSMELLDIKYPDRRVRGFAVRSLDRGLTDDRLLLYLIALVQVLKYEAYADTALSQFLLKRALLNQKVGHVFFWLMRAELAQSTQTSPRFGLLLEAYCRGCGPYLHSLLRQTEACEKLDALSVMVKQRKEEGLKIAQTELTHSKAVLEDFESPLDCSQKLGALVIDDCKVIGSAKRPLWLVWKNPDPLAEFKHLTYEVIFKNGDDLRQDMLTLQVIRIMDSIWRKEGFDLCMIPYGVLPMGRNIGMIEAVKKSKTIHEIQCSQSRIGVGALKNMDRSIINTWLQNHCKTQQQYDEAVERFTLSCAGYCVATFVLGIKDRHQDNIMVTEDGRLFHIDFGHFLGHYKKKLGINRDRVPFVLTDHFITVIAKGATNPRDSDQFKRFQRLCGQAFMILHKHGRLFLSLFTMMLCMGIPELQKLEDVNYLRRTLAVDLDEEAALKYFQEQLNVAYEGGWTTKTNWFFHSMRHM